MPFGTASTRKLPRVFPARTHPRTCALHRSQAFRILLRVDHPPRFPIADELEVASAAEREAYAESQHTNAFASITTGQTCTAALRTKTDGWGRLHQLKGFEFMSILGGRYKLVFFMSPFNTVAASHRGPHRGGAPLLLSVSHCVLRVCVLRAGRQPLVWRCGPLPRRRECIQVLPAYSRRRFNHQPQCMSQNLSPSHTHWCAVGTRGCCKRRPPLSSREAQLGNAV